MKVDVYQHVKARIKNSSQGLSRAETVVHALRILVSKLS